MADDTGKRSLTLISSDGLRLEAEISVPLDALAAVVLCHPHPQQGGSMTSLVTSELFRLLPQAGLAVLRFNFRGVGASEGTHDFGRAEAADVLAAIDAIAAEAPGLAVFVCGWSFGADVALSITDPRITAWIACAPPLRVVPRDELSAAAGSDPRPKLLIVPEHDQFLEPGPAREATSAWIDTEIAVVNGADHFFVGRTDKVAALTTGFVTRLI